MRCKFCDKRLEPHQYFWDEASKQWKEKCEGLCVLSNEDKADLLSDDSEDDGDNEDVLKSWVPET